LRARRQADEEDPAFDDADASAPEQTVAPARQQSTPQRGDDFPGDRPQKTSEKAAAKASPAKTESAEAKAAEDRRAALEERAARARIALQRASEDLPSVSGYDRVWNEKCGQIRQDLEAAGMRGELARLTDFYAQCRSNYGRDENGNSKEGQGHEAAI